MIVWVVQRWVDDDMAGDDGVRLVRLLRLLRQGVWTTSHALQEWVGVPVRLISFGWQCGMSLAFTFLSLQVLLM